MLVEVLIVFVEQVEKEISSSLPQICLLCDTRFPNAAALASHVYEIHGIDMLQITQQQQPTLQSIEPPTVVEKKKKIPNLVKITDLKMKNEAIGRCFSRLFVCLCLTLLLI